MAGDRKELVSKYNALFDKALKLLKHDTAQPYDTAFQTKQWQLFSLYEEYAEAAMDEIKRLQESNASDKEQQIQNILKEHGTIWQKHEALMRFALDGTDQKRYKYFDKFWAAQRDRGLIYLPKDYRSGEPIPEDIELDGARGKLIDKQAQRENSEKAQKAQNARFLSQVALMLDVPHLVSDVRDAKILEANSAQNDQDGSSVIAGTVVLLPKNASPTCEKVTDAQAKGAVSKDAIDANVLLHLTGADAADCHQIQFKLDRSGKQPVGLVLDANQITFDRGTQVKPEDLRVVNLSMANNLVKIHPDLYLGMCKTVEMTPAMLGLCAMANGRSYDQAKGLMRNLEELQDRLSKNQEGDDHSFSNVHEREQLSNAGRRSNDPLYVLKKKTDLVEMLRDKQKDLICIDDFGVLAQGSAKEAVSKNEADCFDASSRLGNPVLANVKQRIGKRLNSNGGARIDEVERAKRFAALERRLRDAKNKVDVAKRSPLESYSQRVSAQRYNRMQTSLHFLMRAVNGYKTARERFLRGHSGEEVLIFCGAREHLLEKIKLAQSCAGRYLTVEKNKKENRELGRRHNGSHERVAAVKELQKVLDDLGRHFNNHTVLSPVMKLTSHEAKISREARMQAHQAHAVRHPVRQGMLMNFLPPLLPPLFPMEEQRRERQEVIVRPRHHHAPAWMDFVPSGVFPLVPVMEQRRERQEVVVRPRRIYNHIFAGGGERIIMVFHRGHGHFHRHLQ